MDQECLFATLGKQKKAILFGLLQDAYEAMNTEQRRHVFGEFAEQELQSANINGHELLDRIQHFHRDSLNGVYYAPFDINSKNFTHIPEETEEWFDILGDCLKRSAKLTEQEDHVQAVECFTLLYALIDTMERGEEIVFADEYGSWMIPGDEKTFVQAYVTSLAAVETPDCDPDGTFVTSLLGDAQELSKWAKMTLAANPDGLRRRREVRSLECEWRFAFPTAVIFDAKLGRLLVSDTQRNRLQIYNKLKDYVQAARTI